MPTRHFFAVLFGLGADRGSDRDAAGGGFGGGKGKKEKKRGEKGVGGASRRRSSRNGPYCAEKGGI